MRGLAFRAAGVLWLLLGIAAILTVFGSLIGIALAALVGVRQSVIAARVGSVLGLALLVPGQFILEMAGCTDGPCGTEPYLLAYALPALVVVLNGIAGWTGGASRPSPPTGPSEDDIAPGQQSLWESGDS